jgi:hypothetical protein
MSASAELKDAPSKEAGVVTWKLSMSPKTDSHVDQLARDIGRSPEDVLGLSLALFTLAVRAKQEGKGIAIVDEQGNIDTEITGF